MTGPHGRAARQSRSPKEGRDYTAARSAAARGRVVAPGLRLPQHDVFSQDFISNGTVMEFRRLGESGLEVSVICLGTMMFGDRTDATAAQRIVASAFDAGVNFIDTADAYAKGASETIVGESIAANRRR